MLKSQAANVRETEKQRAGRWKHVEHFLVFLPTCRVGQPAWNFNCNSEHWGSGQLVFRGRVGSLGELLFSYSSPLGALCKLCSSIRLRGPAVRSRGASAKRLVLMIFLWTQAALWEPSFPTGPVPKIPAGNFPTNST